MGGSGGAIQQLLQCNAVCMYYCGPGSEKSTNVLAVSMSLYPFPFFPCSVRLVSGKKSREALPRELRPRIANPK
jgi:hypothetical protein